MLSGTFFVLCCFCLFVVYLLVGYCKCCFFQYSIDTLENPLTAEIIDQFHSPDTIAKLFQYLKASPSSLVCGVSLLSSVLELQIEGEDSIILLEIIDNIQVFLEVLLSPDEKKIKTSCGQFYSLGRARLAILQFLLTLVTEEPDICTILIESEFYVSLLELVLRHPTNSVLHDIFLQFYLLLCSRDEDEICEVFTQTGLIDRIASLWEAYVKNNRATVPPESYFGHFAILATAITDASEKFASVTSILCRSSKWNTYTAPNIDQYNLEMINVTTI
jgi:hypothetical protein